jgi:hypothetical protein
MRILHKWALVQLWGQVLLNNHFRICSVCVLRIELARASLPMEVGMLLQLLHLEKFPPQTVLVEQYIHVNSPPQCWQAYFCTTSYPCSIVCCLTCPLMRQSDCQSKFIADSLRFRHIYCNSNVHESRETREYSVLGCLVVSANSHLLRRLESSGYIRLILAKSQNALLFICTTKSAKPRRV